MEDIIDRFKARDEDQQQVAANKEKADADAAVAADMRKASMEAFSQTKKRKGGQDVKKSKRATGSDTVAFLREKAKLDAELKREELKIREQKMKDKKADRDNLRALNTLNTVYCLWKLQRNWEDSLVTSLHGREMHFLELLHQRAK